MKLTTSALIVIANASHFRGGSLAVLQGANPGELDVQRSMIWRRGNSGYETYDYWTYGTEDADDGCDQNDVDNQVVSEGMGDQKCYRHGGSYCGSQDATYIVTEIEDQQAESNNYCAGYVNDPLPYMNETFELVFESCCWVDMTTDNGSEWWGSSDYILNTNVYDLDNNSPQAKVPAEWKLFMGCSDQSLALNPVDVDGDTVKCRWSTEDESAGAYHDPVAYASLWLDEDSCVITYDGTVDQAASMSKKPIAVHVEDFDSIGNVKSSVGIQFMGVIWEPTARLGDARQLGPGNPFVYPSSDIGNDDHDDGRKRREPTSEPAYCSSMPVLISPSPDAGIIMDVPMTGVTIDVKANSGNGAITQFTFGSPVGMSCTQVNGKGKSTCTFVPSVEQAGQAFSFCFMATDSAGFQTERRCISLTVGVNIPEECEGSDVDDSVDEVIREANVIFSADESQSKRSKRRAVKLFTVISKINARRRRRCATTSPVPMDVAGHGCKFHSLVGVSDSTEMVGTICDRITKYIGWLHTDCKRNTGRHGRLQKLCGNFLG